MGFDDHEKIQDYSMPDDLKEVVHRLAHDAEDMDLRLSEFKLIQSSRWFAIAVGGAVFITGVIFFLVALFTFFNLFELSYNLNTLRMLGSLSAVASAVQLTAGILLMSK